MIKYRLVCSDGHEFEGWFQSGAAFDAQAAANAVACVACGSTAVSKAIMAPNIAIRLPDATAAAGTIEKRRPAPADIHHHMRQALRDLKDEVTANSEYVGPRFAEEARRIHTRETPQRSIFGEATAEEAEDLTRDGISHCRLPRFPDDCN